MYSSNYLNQQAITVAGGVGDAIPHSEEEIKKYLDILHNYSNQQDITVAGCKNCQESDCFSIYSGYKICESCGCLNGHVSGYYDKKDNNRLHFRKKSIYQRKYHYDKKVNQVSKRLQLTDDEKYDLYNKLMLIDNHVMEILNKQFCRKRMISIFYLIEKILEEMGNENYKLVYVKISRQTLENYEKWWANYKSL